MWIKVFNLQGRSKWSRTDKYDFGFLWLSDYQFKKLSEGDGDKYELHSMLPFIAIVNFEPKKLLCGIEFEIYRDATSDEVEKILGILESYNLGFNDKGNYCFRDYDKICFHVGDKKMSYDEFVNDFKLPKGNVFHEVFDNGFSYIGSEPFYGDNKAYADTAIRVAKNKGCLWFNWSMGFRLDDSFSIHVGYGKDESYSEISNS